MQIHVYFALLQVKDRSVIATADAERRTTAPAGMQSAIDELVARYKPTGRSFVRYVEMFICVFLLF